MREAFDKLVLDDCNRRARVQKKLILLELNEVPYRVIDSYCNRRPMSTLASMLQKSRQYTSVTDDQLALDPWISWSTLHRGVNDEVHGILHLGQVIDSTDAAFPPIWRLLRKRGLKVGVFGSLHSSNIPPDASEYSFYLPDYFDSGLAAYPVSLLPFQKLSLSMTRQSARNVSRSIPFRSALKFALNAPKLGLRMATVYGMAMQLVREAFNARLRIRRRVYQPLIMMDLFIKQLTEKKPEFASFYTNHVAAAMHRYWAASFPEDYGSDRLDDAWVSRYKDEIWFAMDKLDAMLRQLKRFVDRNPEYSLIAAGSMGQAAIPAKKTYDFLTITDTNRFMQALGAPPGGWQSRPAMVPCNCVVVADQYRAAVLKNIQTLSIGGQTIKRDQKPVGPLSFDERHHGDFQFFVQFDSFRGGDTATIAGKAHKLTDVGLGLMAHEDGVNCTAQHVPEGAVFVYPSAQHEKVSSVRKTVSTLDVAPSIMEFFGIEKPPYMRGTSSIDLERPVSG